MAFRNRRLHVKAAPYRGRWIPVVWLGPQLLGCYEDQPSKAEALACARWHAREWFWSQTGRQRSGPGEALRQRSLFSDGD